MDTQTSERLRDFFQKLVQTDAQIKKLKHEINNYYKDDTIKSFNERIKRSLKNHLKHRFRAKSKSKNIYKRNLIHDRNSLVSNGSIAGFVIEEEKLLVQYEPDRKRNFPKCSHSHETNSHEKKLKHPFYKNSQRIDEMLKYNRPTVTNTPIQENTHPNVEPTNEWNVVDYKVYDETPAAVVKMKTYTPPAQETEINLELLLSSTPVTKAEGRATSVNSPVVTSGSGVTNPLSDHMGYRKLMQVNEEDNEEMNYEYVNNVLTDDHQEDDNWGRQTDRMKRESDQQPESHPHKLLPSEILNPNWKGPMPFYPDEINSMIKHAALQNFNIKLPLNTKPKTEREKFKKDVSDTEYIEDYTEDKFNKIAKMAQAYSDYGVVYNRKADNGKDKISKGDDRYKQSMEKRFFKNNIFGDMSEGIRFEFKSGTNKDERQELVNDVTKHIKFVKENLEDVPSPIMQPVNPIFQNVFSNQFTLPVNKDFAKTKHKNANYDLGVKKVLRTLKAIAEPEANKNVSVESQPVNNTNAIDDVFGFIALMGDWFRKLSMLSGDVNETPEFKNGSKLNITKVDNKKSESNKSDTLYPLYDFDMVDNIGHRSRVLMSVDGNNVTEDMAHGRYETIKKYNTTETDSIVPMALVIAANTSNTTELRGDVKENLTSIVKRSIDDSKLVFWNGLYDDEEYGIKSDYSDSVKEKHIVKNRNVFQKTRDWITDKLRNKTRKAKKKTKAVGTKAIHKTPVEKPKKSDGKLKARNTRNTNENVDDVKKQFAILTANMKKVCQEAAKALEGTKTIEVREDKKEGIVATSMMQQLVRLMNDLVEIQVQQKTCAKLPSDLRNFLEWLTVPEEGNLAVDGSKNSVSDYDNFNGFGRYEKSTESELLTTITEDSHQDDRTECLGTIKAVQDLIIQYEGMNDEDKSKMSGVKEYLQHQLTFLNKKLSGFNDNNLFKMYKKRDLSRVKRTWRKKMGKQGNKFIKNFGKKHTRTTPDSDVTKNEENGNINKMSST